MKGQEDGFLDALLLSAMFWIWRFLEIPWYEILPSVPGFRKDSSVRAVLSGGRSEASQIHSEPEL